MDKGSFVQGRGEHRAILGTLDQIGLSYSGKEAGVSVRDIMGTAGSGHQSTFETFYHKQAMSDYSEAVLGGKEGIALNNTLYAALSRSGIEDSTVIFRSYVKSEFHN